VVGADAQRALSSGAFALAFAPDGRTVVYSAGRVLFGWGPARARESHRLELAEHVLDAAFTPGARHLVTASKDGVARVWDVEARACSRAGVGRGTAAGGRGRARRRAGRGRRPRGGVGLGRVTAGAWGGGRP
jgi:hypothetical protein